MASKEEKLSQSFGNFFNNTVKAATPSLISQPAGSAMPRMQNEQVVMIDPKMIGPFSIPSAKPDGGQAFEVNRDQEYESLKEKILRDGIQQPAVVRPWKYDGSYRYEMIVGHRRRMICLDTDQKLPCIIRNLDDNEATIVMTTTNTETRHKLKPSELAWAYRMEFDARKHQGKPIDIVTDQEEEEANDNAPAELTTEQIGRSRGISARTVSRYIRLTYLHTEILHDYVDTEQIKLTAAVSLSYLPEDIQEEVLRCLQKGIRIDDTKATLLKDSAKRGALAVSDVEDCLLGKAKKKAPSPTLKVPAERLKAFFPKKVKPAKMEQDLFEAMTISSVIREYFPNSTAEEICVELNMILKKQDG